MKVKGLRELIDRLQKGARSVKTVREAVKKNGVELEKTMKRNATFVKGYQTGETKRSISLDLQDAGFKAEVAPGTEYSYWLEKGTRFMGAQPFVEPSLKQIEPQFQRDVEKASKGE